MVTKKVIVSGLDTDYLQKPFEELLKLVHYADDYVKLTPFCTSCWNGKEIITKALFTHRTTIIISDPTVHAGGAEMYEPACRQCWNHSNI